MTRAFRVARSGILFALGLIAGVSRFFFPFFRYSRCGAWPLAQAQCCAEMIIIFDAAAMMDAACMQCCPLLLHAIQAGGLSY